MFLSDVSVRRPVLAIVVSILLILFGLMGLSRLSVREYPDIDPPLVSVSTVYPGANPEVVESTITEPLEEELTSIEGIKTLTSKSQEQLSSIIIEFELDRDVDVAAQDVRDRVSRARGRLPNDIEEPIVTKQDSDAQAILWISLYGDDYSPLQISDYAERYIKDQLQTVAGVGRVIIGGRREYAMRLWLEPEKMAAHQVTALDVRDALADNNVEIPSGRIEGEEREFTVRTQGQMKRPEAFNRMIVKEVDGMAVRIEDIGWAEIGARDDRSLVRFNGIPAVGLGIVKQSKANTIDVAHGVKEKLKEIRKTLPKGLNMEAAYDSSLFIEKSVEEVKETLYIAGFLVVLVIFIFLRNLRSTFIPAVAIPVSIVATFGIMYALGYTINILTLLGLTIAIGLVVDDTIVVLENIYRHIEEGEPPFEAALKGTREIGFAVLATTFVLVAVFIPLAFMTGTTGRLFSEFAIVVAGSVLISGFVSLTLAPALCGKMLKPITAKQTPHPEAPARGITRWLDGFNKTIDSLRQTYSVSLAWAMQHRPLVVFEVAVLCFLSLAAFNFLPKEFLPLEDRSQVFTVVSAPEGATLEYTDKAVRQAEAIYRAQPEVNKFFSVIALSAEGVGAVNSGFIFVTLVPKNERERKQQTVVEAIFPMMFGIPEAFVFPINPPSGPTRGAGKPFQMVIQGFDINELAEVTQKIVAKANEIPGMIQVDTDLKLNKPQLEVTINRDKASELGVTIRDIATTMQILLGGRDLSTFQLNSKRYDVMVQMPKQFRMTPEQLDSIYVPGAKGQLVPLSNVVNTYEAVAPQSFNHYSRLRAATIDAVLLPFLSMGDAISKMEKIAHEEMPVNMRIEWAGESREFLLTQSASNYVFWIAILVVFLVLAAQFESFIHPLIILVTVPLAICGAILSLYFTSSSLNIYSIIGMILLVGLVTKNGILIVENANQQLEADPLLSARDAAIRAAEIRFRPILMTSLATIIALVPVALGYGAGGESRQPLGIAIVGGMLVSTFFTLYVIPMVYDWVNRRLRKNQDTQPHNALELH
jgi:hydrophobe/amphiphile efflux-1 (HAE1) family protein